LIAFGPCYHLTEVQSAGGYIVLVNARLLGEACPRK
jgi:hypothetical protein